MTDQLLHEVNATLKSSLCRKAFRYSKHVKVLLDAFATERKRNEQLEERIKRLAKLESMLLEAGYTIRK